MTTFLAQKQKINLIVFTLLALFQIGCASSTYHFTSDPDGANVYYFDPVTSKRMLLGVTPLGYQKSSIPDKKSFVISVEKEGYSPEETPVAPNDGTKTFLHFKLKPDKNGLKKSDFEINGVIKSLFRAQEQIYSKKYQAAIVELDKILVDRPNLVQALIFKGTAYYLLQDLNSAIESWKKVLSIEPNNE